MNLIQKATVFPKNIANEYLKFKKQLLFELALTDGLGLLESGIFEKYETILCKNLKIQSFELHNQNSSSKQKQLAQTQSNLPSLADHEHGFQQHHCNLEQQNISDNCSQLSQKISQKLSHENDFPLPYHIFLNLKEAHQQSKINSTCHQLDNIFTIINSLQQETSKVQKNNEVNKIIGQLKFQLTQFYNQLKNKQQQFILQKQEEVKYLKSQYNAPLSTRRSEKQIGKRQLILLVNEKNLQEKKQQLRNQQIALRQRQLQLQKQKQRLQIRESMPSCRFEGKRQEGTKIYNIRETGVGLTKQRIQFLNQKVKFQSFKKDTLFQMQKQNSMLQSDILPRLKQLHNRMNLQFYQ